MIDPDDIPRTAIEQVVMMEGILIAAATGGSPTTTSTLTCAGNSWPIP